MMNAFAFEIFAIIDMYKVQYLYILYERIEGRDLASKAYYYNIKLSLFIAWNRY